MAKLLFGTVLSNVCTSSPGSFSFSELLSHSFDTFPFAAIFSFCLPGRVTRTLWRLQGEIHPASSSKRVVIHEVGPPVPGAERNSWHYLLQMVLKMLLVRLTKALINSWRWALLRCRYEPPPPLHARACTRSVSTHSGPHLPARNLCIFNFSLQRSYVWNRKRKRQIYDAEAVGGK